MTPHGKRNNQNHTQPPSVLAYYSYLDGGHGNVQPESSSLHQSAEKVSQRETGFARASRVRHFAGGIPSRLTASPRADQRDRMQMVSSQERGEQRDHHQRRHADQRSSAGAVDALHEGSRLQTGIMQRSGAALQARSTVLRCVGGVASCPSSNRARCRRCGLGERFEQVFEETRRPNDCRNSVASVSRSGLIKRPTSSSRSASVARSAPRNSTSPAIASRLTRRSWRCSTSCGPASGLECRSESNQRQDRSAGWPEAPVRSSRSIPVGWVASRRDCRAAVCPRGDEPRGSIPAAGYAALGRGSRNNGSLITGSGAGLAISDCKPEQLETDGDRMSELAAQHVTSADVAAPIDHFFSSGDGLGIHQPGSNTRGGDLVATAPSGRARDRAMCPAVARFNRRAA
jgi:hypothetical protein